MIDMNHDASYKLLFSHPEMVAELLRGYVKEPWVEDLDFASLEKVNASYVSEDLRQREDDVVWRVKLGPRWVYLYLLLEFQSSVEPFMAVRLLAYVGLLYQDLIRQGLAGGRLPPVLPIVIYNGERTWTAATELAQLIEPMPPALRRWLDAEAQRPLRRSFALWVQRVLLRERLAGQTYPELNELNEVRDMLAERVKEWTEQWKQEGLAAGLAEGLAQGLSQGLSQGLERGRTEGEAALLLRQMNRRFGPLPEAACQRIALADAETLLVWGERLLDARSLDEVWGH